MHRTDGDGFVVEGGLNRYSDTTQPRSTVAAEALNAVQEELCNVVTEAGFVVETTAAADRTNEWKQVSTAIPVLTAEQNAVEWQGEAVLVDGGNNIDDRTVVSLAPVAAYIRGSRIKIGNDFYVTGVLQVVDVLTPITGTGGQGDLRLELVDTVDFVVPFSIQQSWSAVSAVFSTIDATPIPLENPFVAFTPISAAPPGGSGPQIARSIFEIRSSDNTTAKVLTGGWAPQRLNPMGIPIFAKIL